MFVKKHLLIMVVMLFSLALQACTFNAGGPKYPQYSIPISAEAAQNLQQVVADAVTQGALSGEFSLMMTETHLTSTLALNLSQQNLVEAVEPLALGEAIEQANPQEQITSIVSNPQVYLQDGQIQVYGTLQYGLFATTGRVILSVAPDAQGNLVFELTEMDFGSLLLPDGLKSSISTALSSAISGAFGPITTGFRIESITIADGTMTLKGRTR